MGGEGTVCNGRAGAQFWRSPHRAGCMSSGDSADRNARALRRRGSPFTVRTSLPHLHLCVQCAALRFDPFPVLPSLPLRVNVSLRRSRDGSILWQWVPLLSAGPCAKACSCPCFRGSWAGTRALFPFPVGRRLFIWARGDVGVGAQCVARPHPACMRERRGGSCAPLAARR